MKALKSFIKPFEATVPSENPFQMLSILLGKKVRKNLQIQHYEMAPDHISGNKLLLFINFIDVSAYFPEVFLELKGKHIFH